MKQVADSGHLMMGVLTMNNYEATEIAYKNGYEAGIYEDDNI